MGQSVAVAGIVAAAAIWLGWRFLLPGTLRSRLRTALGLAPPPPSGCSGGCGGCEPGGGCH